ncbi:transcription initiation factor IIF auxiliary subunit, partial [Bartonella silvatica]
MDVQTASVASKTTSVEVAEEVDEADDTDDRLTMESAHALLKSLGWSTEKNNENDHMASYQLADREVDILYNDEIAKDYPQF